MPWQQRWQARTPPGAARRDGEPVPRAQGGHLPASLRAARQGPDADLGRARRGGDPGGEPVPSARDRADRHRRLRAAERARGGGGAVRRRHRRDRRAGEPAARAGAYGDDPARDRCPGGGDAGAVPADRRAAARGRGGGAGAECGDRARGRPRALSRGAARLGDAVDAPAGEGAASREDRGPSPGDEGGAGGSARFRGNPRRPGLRLFPHGRHHRAAEGGAAPGERHPLQRLVRAVLHLHRGGRAALPAADVSCIRGLSDPDVLPDDRGAGGDADAAGLSRRGGHGPPLEADRAPQGRAS